MNARRFTQKGLGHPSDAYVVETVDVAAIVDEYLHKQHRREEQNGDQTHAIVDLAERVAVKYGQTPEACVRRLFAIRSGESKATNLTLFECILDAIDSHLCFHDIAVFPGGRDAAREIAEAWTENALEARRLASSLMNFTRGFISGDQALNGELEMNVEEAA